MRPALLALAAVLLASGCVQDGQPGETPVNGSQENESGGYLNIFTEPIPPGPGENWYCGSFRLNSSLAGGKKINSTVAAARQAGLSFMGMVINHSRDDADLHLESCSQATQAGFPCIPCQVAGNCDGWLVAIGLDEPIGSGLELEGMIDRIHDGGGVAYITHPMQEGECRKWRRWDITAWDGLAVVSPMRQKERDDEKALEKWHGLLSNGHHVYALGETDVRPFRSRYELSNMLDSSYQCLYIEGNLTWESVREALLSGRFYVTNGPVINFTVNGHGPGEGVVASYGEEVNISLDVSSTTPFNRVRVIKNGIAIQEVGKTLNRYSTSMTSMVARDAWFSVEIWGSDYTPQYHDFTHAISNPVWVSVAEPG
jgi:hypothetical protein